MSEEPAPRRRQARGERRIAQLLQAAASVFCRTGYAAASTNAIAREAKVSPGTLYQYFPNKEAIAVELGDRLLQEMRETQGLAFDRADLELPLPELVDAVLEPVIEFNCRNPAFLALMHGSGDVPGRIAEEHEAVHESMLTRVGGLIEAMAPGLDAGERRWIAAMALGIVKAGLDLVLAAPEGAERDGTVAELKRALVRYLDPLYTPRRLGAPHR
ncbi:TetR/AcrR family transcriptional regulator [Streptomyces sp. NPDC048604]|uniref:TetR/AcrR family transcriptional regulator n=1 Tax=Streptomyces sp. NPDC048604 TaxID=3365578 RepID=UPI0037148212